MSDSTSERLYNLLPAILRIRDVERGEPLRALLGIIESQAHLVEEDVAALYDDWFIETCAEWVVPYLGDLLGVRHLHAIEDARVLSQRAFVANTLYYRKRKGTLQMLEDLARDVTGWGAHAVAFFELLGWTQHLNHRRYTPAANPYPHSKDWQDQDKLNPAAVDRVGTINLRSLDVVDRLDGPFDVVAHTVDIRPIAQHEGWHNIRKIGFFLWRLQSYPMRQVEARVSATGVNRFYFSTLGHPAPLFNNPDRKHDDVGLATEVNVPDPIRPIAFMQHPGDYYGINSDKSFAIYKQVGAADPAFVPENEIMCKDLSAWSQPPAGMVAVDVRLGRLMFHSADTIPDAVMVTHHYGFSGDVGGGPYDRQATLITPERPDEAGPGDWAVVVAHEQPEPDPSFDEWRDTIAAAFANWDRTVHPRAVITILDNGTYAENITLELEAGQHVVIQADNEQRPTVRFVDDGGVLDRLTIQGGAGDEAALTLSGLLMEGWIKVAAGSLGQLDMIHCTLVPGRALDEDGEPVAPGEPSIEVADANDSLEVSIDYSIVGRLQMPEDMKCLTVRDSIIDAANRDAPAEWRPALLSGSLNSFSSLPAGSRIMVKIGEEGPHVVELKEESKTRGQARKELQKGFVNAPNSRAFTQAHVILKGKRILVVPGVSEPIRITNYLGDNTARLLRLDDEGAAQRDVLVSGPVTSFPLSNASPRLEVQIGDEKLHTATLSGVPKDRPEARKFLQEAIHDAHSTAAFKKAVVALAGQRLIVVPGRTNAAVAFDVAPADPTTLGELELRSPRPAIAQGLTGDAHGPPTVLKRTTVFGEVYVKTLTLGSEVIFTDRVMAQQRQTGCVRYSYVDDLVSVTPRRFRCQPGLALEEAARQQETTLDKLSTADKDRIRADMRPVFTSDHYGDPGYAQLSLITDEGVRTGAEDGAEMGVFSHLKQPQRETNLRIRIDEFLPYGLDADIIYVT